MKHFLSSIIFLLLFFEAASQKSTTLIEAELLFHFNRIDNWIGYPRSDDSIQTYDSVELENNVLSKKMVSYFNSNPKTLSGRFDSLKPRWLNIATSADGNFRIYSWNSQTGGTMRFFYSVIQYRTSKGVKAILYFDPLSDSDGNNGFFYKKIFTVTKGKETYYLATRTAIYSSKDLYHGVKIFKVQGERLNDTARLIRTTTGIRNELGYEFDFFSIIDMDYEKRPEIKFDSRNKTLLVPLVLDNGKVTNKFISYKFNGQYFINI